MKTFLICIIPGVMQAGWWKLLIETQNVPYLSVIGLVIGLVWGLVAGIYDGAKEKHDLGMVGGGIFGTVIGAVLGTFIVLFLGVFAPLVLYGFVDWLNMYYRAKLKILWELLEAIIAILLLGGMLFGVCYLIDWHESTREERRLESNRERKERLMRMDIPPWMPSLPPTPIVPYQLDKQ